MRPARTHPSTDLAVLAAWAAAGLAVALRRFSCASGPQDPQGADLHPTWLEELVRTRIAGLRQDAGRARRIRHIGKQPDHCGVLLAVLSARPLSGHPRPADVNAPVAGPLEVVWFNGQPGGANGCGQRRM